MILRFGVDFVRGWQRGIFEDGNAVGVVLKGNELQLWVLSAGVLLRYPINTYLHKI